MDNRSLASNISVAFLSQGMAFAVSAITALLVPKVLGVSEFGYWQLFLFYSSYTGFFHFGLNDGVYLLIGGQERRETDKSAIASQFRLGMSIQTVFAIFIIIVTSADMVETERSFVLGTTAIYLLLFNASGFLGYTFQALNETKLYSFSVMVDRVAFLAALIIVLVVRVESFEWYVVFYCAAKALSLAFCVWKARDILAAPSVSIQKSARLVFSSVRVGIKLMLANIASMLILGVMRFVVDVEWGIEVFGMVSFALTLSSFFLQMMSQVSMVLFPALRRVPEHEQRLFFIAERDAFGLLLPAAYLFYLPMCWVLALWLPQYEASFAYFAFLLPLCVFDGKMSMVSTTFMKVRREEGLLLKVNAVSVVASSLLVWVGVYVLGSVDATLCMVTCVIAARSIAGECILMRRMDCLELRVLAGELFVSVAFVTSTVLIGSLASFVATFFAYLLHLVLNRRRIVGLAGKVSAMRKNRG